MRVQQQQQQPTAAVKEGEDGGVVETNRLVRILPVNRDVNILGSDLIGVTITYIADKTSYSRPVTPRTAISDAGLGGSGSERCRPLAP